MGARSRTAGARLRHVVAPWAGHHDHQHVGHAEHGEERRQPRAAPGRQIRTFGTRLGSATTTPCAGARSWCRAADGAGASTCARPAAGVWIRWCRDVAQGSLLVDLAVVPRSGQEGLERSGWSMGREEGNRNPCRARGPGEVAAAPARVQGGRTAGHGHQPHGRRSLLVRVVLGAGQVHSVRRHRSVQPKEVASLRLGGMVERAAHPSRPEQPLNGGPQMVEVSRDGRRIYFTNSLYTPWDSQFYPDGIKGWIAKVDVPTGGGAMRLDEKFLLETGDMRPHQIRLDGGDASSDSYCYA